MDRTGCKVGLDDLACCMEAIRVMYFGSDGWTDGADACNMPYMPCVCAYNGFGFGFNAGRACLLCVPVCQICAIF